MIKVLINLRIPSLTLKPGGDAPPKRLDNSTVRYMKHVELPALPKVGDLLDMTAAVESASFGCKVTRAEWDERENLFVISCSYARPSIPEAVYRSLSGSPDWTAKPLF